VHAAAWGVAAAAAPLPFLSPLRTLPRFTSVYMAVGTTGSRSSPVLLNLSHYCHR
jgi:hypothetical protein